MEQNLQAVLDLINGDVNLSDEEKTAIAARLKEADKKMSIDTFRVERGEHLKRTMSVLLEETIAELEQKRKVVEDKNRELEIEGALEKVRTVAMSMRTASDLLNICKVLFEELSALGFSDLRNAMVNIVNDEKGSFLNYDFNDGNSSVTQFSHNSHMVIERQVAITSSAADAFIEHVLTGGELEDFKAFRVKNGEPPDPRLENIPALYYYFYSIGDGSVGVSAFSPLGEEKREILKRFRNVFDLAYRRYADIAQAEAQAREAQIELSLERIRASAMAMHKTDQLLDAAELLYKELTGLGISSMAVTYSIMAGDEKSAAYYSINPVDGKINPVPLDLPHTETKVMRSILASWKKQETFNKLELDEKATLQRQTYVARKIEAFFAKHNFDYNFSVEAFLAVSPKKAVIYTFNFAQGYIFIIGSEHLTKSQEEMVMRFTKVFEMTYRRFLDLKQAEEQAREAQIQLALERVRARTMAMQKSEELHEVIQLIFDQLLQLNFNIDNANFILDYLETDDGINTWIAVAGAQYSVKIYVPYLKHPAFDRFNKAKHRGGLLTDTLSLKEKNSFFAHFFKYAPHVSEERRAFVFDQPGFARSAVFMKNTVLSITKYQSIPFSEAENNTLLRFGQVFDQTYTRFNDLKQAEEQAREAQIQLALERVRARTMAMQHSEDLSETASDMFKQIQSLGMHPWACGFNIFDRDEKTVTQWMSLADGGISPPFRTPLTEDPFFIEIYEARRQKKDLLVMESSGKDLEETHRYMFSLPDSKKVFGDIESSGFEMPKFQITHCAYFSQGYLVFITYEQVVQSHDIFKRFARIFEQTYTRFLDLQKAETQAREAQIQLGLERVRARAMAMQNSDELAELVRTVFKELTKLDFALTRCIINILDANTNSARWWMANIEDDKTPASYFIGYKELSYFKSAFKAWEERDAKWEYILGEEDKSILDDYLFSETELKMLPVQVQAGMRSSKSLVISAAYGNFGCLHVASLEPLSEENREILARFGHVFDLTYTRFNDLQKAEEQAREAQIQLALERVRARTMAMQRSEELAETVFILFQQFKELGENPDQATIGIINEKEHVIEYWVTMYGSQDNRVFKFSIDEPHVTRKIYDAWKHKKKSLVIDLQGKELHDFARYRESMGGARLNEGEKRRIINVAFFSKGLINVQSLVERSEESIHLLERFAAVFESTYTRFLDLKQAEAQAREAQIEAALEKVRSRSLAMHRSDELQEVVTVVFSKLRELQLPFDSAFIVEYKEGTRDITQWVANSEKIYSHPMSVPYTDNIFTADMWDAKESGKDFFAKVYTGNEKKKGWEDLFENSDYKNIPQERKDFIRKAKTCAYHYALSKHSTVAVVSYSGQVLSETENDIVKRMGRVFEQAYVRFLDLQKAEVQAREAQIEAALERTRTQSMIMQHSSELDDTLRVFHEQVLHLGINSAFSFLWLPDEEKDRHIFWAAWAENDSKVFKSKAIDYPLDRNDPATVQCLIDWKGKEPVVSYRVPPEGVKDYFAAWQELVGGVKSLAPKHFKEGLYYVEAFMKYGGFGVIVQNTLTEDENKILGRFAVEFERTYTRFLDLKKAEAQVRKGQIEASLERVRSKTMAMHSSNDVADTVALMFDELVKLGVEKTVRSGIGILTRDNSQMELWTAKASENEKAELIVGHFDMNIHPMLRGIYNAWDKKEVSFSYVLTGDDMTSYFETINNQPGYPIKYDLSKLPPKQYQNDFFFAEGILFAFTSGPLSAEISTVFKRFAGVFGQTYRRYLDLRKAEAQARESQIEAALERVRSRTLAMQKSDELAETAAVLFRQMIGLGIEPNRLYIGITREDTTDIEFWITDEDGSRVSTMFTADSSQNVSMHKMHNAWKEHQKSIVIDMQGQELNDYFHYLGDILHVPFKGGLTQKRRVQYISFFSNGFIGMASPDDQPQATADLLDRFAYVFNLTFARFNDLKLAEMHALQAEQDLIEIKAARKNAEDALTDLRSAQRQLIQSEKMASLGELTAGIAHEIQNPLNFVNNFSEVSAELIDEMAEEMEKGDIEEAKAIASDIRDNLQKIRHHGKRADGIVKGMLQHSRASSNVKEPTDINKLADEYLHLAYHGLRAKDKSFNAELIMNFEEKLPKANVVPQDIGRVILNMINNAFYATQQKARDRGADYKPAVEVSTSSANDHVVIKIKDNGNGIPDAIKDKIMQPFFTTKPTGEGTGLGLSLAYDIVVKGHGGSIEVKSTEGEGSEFIIKLPINAIT